MELLGVKHVKKRAFSMLIIYKLERREVYKIYLPGICLPLNFFALVLIMISASRLSCLVWIKGRVM